MEVQETNIIVFSNNHDHVRTFEECFRRHPELGCRTDLCSLKSSTEEMFEIGRAHV